jgi:hypothetical protein
MSSGSSRSFFELTQSSTLAALTVVNTAKRYKGTLTIAPKYLVFYSFIFINESYSN